MYGQQNIKNTMRCGRDSSGPLQGQAGSCEYVNGLSGSITCGERLEQLRNCLLLKTDYAPWSLEFASQSVYQFCGHTNDCVNALIEEDCEGQQKISYHIYKFPKSKSAEHSPACAITADLSWGSKTDLQPPSIDP